MSQLAQQLLETPLGATLSAAEASELAGVAKARSLGKGQFLFRPGDKSTALYVILTGSLDVVLDTGADAARNVVAKLGPGQIVGELEVMTNALRVAGLMATEDSTLLELGSDRYNEMLNQNKPSATKLTTVIARTLARRLAAVNQRLTDPATRKATPAPAPVAVAKPAVLPAEDSEMAVLDKLWG